MDEFARKLRASAQSLSLSDGEVARRLGISQQRFTHYANGTRKPDFGTLARICRILQVTPNDLLGFTEPAAITPEEVLRLRIAAATSAMDATALRRAAAVVDALIVADRDED